MVARFPDKSALVVVVINQPDNVENNDKQVALFSFFKESMDCLWEMRNLFLFRPSNSRVHFLAICRFEGELRIPRKQGVGLARKIGADVICQLIQAGLVRSNWIRSTDADALLPADYFDEVAKQNGPAAVYDFTHVPSGESDLDAATQLYEIWLKYYVEALEWAGSHYAYPTIGSCLAFDADAYCKVRGFPKKAGGEDFYLLNKLAKLGTVELIPSKVALHSRESDRVPFGTGPAVSKIMEMGNPAKDYLVYSPRVFVALKEILKAFDKLSLEKSAFVSWLRTLNPQSIGFLEEQGFEGTYEKLLKHCSSQKQLNKQIDEWFDGFRTLKFIHHMEQHCYPPIAIENLSTELERYEVKLPATQQALPS